VPGEIMQQEWALFQQAYRIKNDERRSGGAFILVQIAGTQKLCYNSLQEQTGPQP
jgi:hypothetical protein